MLKNVIGELTPSLSGNRLAAELYCAVPESVNLSIIVQDELGRSRWEYACALPAGASTLQLDLPMLADGSYNAWIEVGGETVIRSFKLEGIGPTGLIGRLFQLLS